ncbi:hypothetical protein JQ507_14565 [Bradyrhizobium sp. PSBB068]|jgi:hypothetical protein|nr:hypothetical protein JQ507_14565 [Bradyrhizobium sp. PSBB068]
MLRVVVDLIPGGFTPLRRTIACMTIANESNLADQSDYRIEAMEGRNHLADLPPRNMSAVVENHDRRQSVWHLIAKAAAAAAEAESDPL